MPLKGTWAKRDVFLGSSVSSSRSPWWTRCIYHTSWADCTRCRCRARRRRRFPRVDKFCIVSRRRQSSSTADWLVLCTWSVLRRGCGLCTEDWSQRYRGSWSLPPLDLASTTELNTSTSKPFTVCKLRPSRSATDVERSLLSTEVFDNTHFHRSVFVSWSSTCIKNFAPTVVNCSHPDLF